MVNKWFCDGAVIPDDQCDVVVGDEGYISVVDGDVIKDKVVAKQGDEPLQVLEKNGVGQDGVLAEDKFEDQGRSIKRQRLMADKKPKDDADKKPKMMLNNGYAFMFRSINCCDSAMVF